jgi:Flp pilus assembly protein TadD
MRPSLPPLLFVLLLLGAGATRADAVDDALRLHRAGETRQALDLAERTIAAQPRDARMRFLKGVILVEQQRRAEAEQVFAALTDDFPELPDPYNNLAVLYAADGRLQAALAALQAALRNDPSHRAARENLGDVHLALAIEAWSSAASGASGDSTALQRKLRLAREIAAPPGPGRPG